MSRSSFPLYTAGGALVLVPEDEAANVFQLGHVYVRCSHESEDPGSTWLKRTIGGASMPAEFHVVATCEPKPTWEGVMDSFRESTTIPTPDLWEVTPDVVEVLAPPGQPVTVDGKALEPVDPDSADPEAAGVPNGLSLYRFEATVPSWDDFPDPLAPETFRQLLWPAEYRIEHGGHPVATVFAYRGHSVKLKLKVPPLGRLKDSNKAEIVAGRNRAVFTEAERAARSRRPAYQRGRPGFQSLGEARAFGESVGASQDTAREHTRTTTWQARPPGFLFSADSREARESTYRSRSQTAAGRGDDAQELGEGEVGDASPSPTVSLTVSGVEVGRRYADIADQVLRAGALIEGIRDMVTSFRLGWYVDVDYQFGVGNVALSWGWKEAADHRAFLGAGVDVDLTLFSGRFEAGFGIKMGGRALGAQGSDDPRPFFEAVGFFYFSGDFKLQFGVERDAPEVELGMEAEVRASMRGGVGVRVATPLGANLALSGETGVELRRGKLVLDPEAGARLEGDVWWLGFEAKAEVTIGARDILGSRGAPRDEEKGVEGSYGTTIPKIEPRKLGDFTLPSYKYAKDLTPARIAEVLHDEFEVEWWEIDQWFSFDLEAEGPSGRIGAQELAERVTRAILRHPEVRRDEATVAAVATRCRTELERYMRGRIDLDPEIPRSGFTRLLEFIHSDDERTATGRTTLRGILTDVAVGSGALPSN